VPRPNIKDPTPCVSLGRDRAGDPVVVVCTTGVDLDLVPFAADARAALAARTASELEHARLILAMPERDVVAVTRELASALRRPAEIVGLQPSQLAAPGPRP
jgi:hypothetical protein